jgi:hypothetical protein
MRRIKRAGALAVLFALSIAACTAAPASPTAPVSPGGSGSLAPSPTSTYRVDPMATPSQAATPGVPEVPPMPILGPLTAAPWTSLRWMKVPVEYFGLPISSGDASGWDVVGWSRGWSAFHEVSEEDSPDGRSTVTTIDTYHSTDGLRWISGAPIKWVGYGLADVSVVEGPAGLLAYDEVGVMCGSVDHADTPIAMSADGITWTPVDNSVFSRASLQSISGGSAGYIAAGLDGVWTSANGLAWRKAALTGKAFQGLDGIYDGVSISSGYVISGVAYGPSTDGCGGGPTLLRPAVWWSPDGTTWSRAQLPGAKADTPVALWRLSDQLLWATQSEADGAGLAWESNDGRTWKAIPTTDTLPDDSCFYGGQQLSVQYGSSEPVTVWVTRTDLTAIELEQTGDLPDSDQLWENSYLKAYGPTGVIFLTTTGAYIGVPQAG